LSCEIILVDNNCSDRTIELAKKTWDSIGNPFELKIIKETTPGLSFARKSGVFAAKGEILIFCDDDNWLEKNYLFKSFKIMTSNPNIGVLGGRSYPIFEIQEPIWFTSYQSSYAVGVQDITSGDVTNKGYVWGAGFVMKKDTITNLFNFGFQFLCSDRKGESLASGGDTEICKWHQLIGKQLWYSDELIFGHFIPSQRLSIEYCENLLKGIHHSKVIIDKYNFILNRTNQINRGVKRNYKIIKLTIQRILNLRSKNEIDNEILLLNVNCKLFTKADNELKKIKQSLDIYKKTIM
jgi:glycosyltransferase involved in cell wall biosynthesis